MDFKKTITINNKDYLIKKSTRKNKKYDVINPETNKKITSFGDSRYQQYKDKIGLYKDLDHNDEKRLLLYHERHKENNDDPTKASFWSNNYLWPMDDFWTD